MLGRFTALGLLALAGPVLAQEAPSAFAKAVNVTFEEGPY